MMDRAARSVRRFVAPLFGLTLGWLTVGWLAVGGLGVGVASAQARTFTVASSGNRIQFVSDAPLERITGVTSSVSGSFSVDPADLSTLRGTIRVPVASLRTGIELRDEHLRGEGWLDATRFPDATLELVGVEGASALRPNEVARVTLRGRFTIHGVSREITASAQVRWLPASDELRAQGITGDFVRAQVSFDVSLPEFGISVNPLVRLKVSDTIRVNVTLRAATS